MLRNVSGENMENSRNNPSTVKKNPTVSYIPILRRGVEGRKKNLRYQ